MENQETEKNNKKKNSYNQWTEEETDELLKLLVEVTLQRRKDKNGAFTKKTVEEKILPKLNQICGCNKTYVNFKGKYKWFKNRLGQYQEMFKSSSGFGWNKDLKMIDGTEEMWEDYLKGHPNHSTLRLENGRDYGDLLLVFGNKCATGKVTVDLTQDGTSARTSMEEDEQQDDDEDANGTHREQYDNVFGVAFEPYSEEENSDSQDMNTNKIQTQKAVPRKRARNENNDSSSSSPPTGQSEYIEKLIMNSSSIASTIESMHAIILEKAKEKAKEREDRKIEREIRRLETDKKENELWDIVYAMSEITLEQKLKVIEMLDSNHKKSIFRRFNAEERKLWIASKLRE